MTLIMNCETRLKDEEIVLTCFYTNVSKRKWTMNLTIACSDLNWNTIFREYTVEVIIMPAHRDQALPLSVYNTSYTSK